MLVENVEKKLLFIAGVSTTQYSHSEKQFVFLAKLNIILQYSPVITFVGICPNKLKTEVHPITCT